MRLRRCRIAVKIVRIRINIIIREPRLERIEKNFPSKN
jgi:hypothetical protein